MGGCRAAGRVRDVNGFAIPNTKQKNQPQTPLFFLRRGDCVIGLNKRERKIERRIGREKHFFKKIDSYRYRDPSLYLHLRLGVHQTKKYFTLKVTVPLSRANQMR